MVFNLLNDAWIPVTRSSGASDVIRPAEIVDQKDPVRWLNFGRAEIDSAAKEFLTGLFAVGFAPKDDDQWLERWETAPSVAEVDVAFEPFVHAFNVDGDGPRFMQCPGAALVTETRPIVGLPLSGPSKDAALENTDIFNKRDAFRHLSPGVAAMMLFSTNAWGGRLGGGHRMPMRGAGPLTTVVAPRDPNLWKEVWLSTPNVDPSYPPAAESVEAIFPWVGKTLTSSNNEKTTPRSSHILHAYFGVPRRMFIDFVENAGKEPCPFGGVVADSIAVQFRLLKHGASYEAFPHPLSPAKVTGDKKTFFTTKAEGVPYAAWPTLLRPSKGVHIAKAVADAERRLLIAGERSAALCVWGYAIGSTVETFVEASMPVYVVPPDVEDVFYSAAQMLADAADTVVACLESAVAKSVMPIDRLPPRDQKRAVNAACEKTLGITLRQRFYSGTESTFYALLTRLSRDLPDADDRSALVQAVAEEWLGVLKREGLATFHSLAPSVSDGGSPALRAVKELNGLSMIFAGLGDMGAKLFKLLGVASPQSKRKAA